MSGLINDENWHAFLKAIGTSERAARAALRRSLDLEQGVEPPPWVSKAFVLVGAGNTQSDGAQAIVEPWLQDARRHLLLALRAINRCHSRVVIDTKAVGTLLKGLEDDLFELAIRPVLLEAEIAERTDTTQRSYGSYLKSLSNATAKLELLGLYPGLALTLEEACNRWLGATVEFLTRFVEDHQAIRCHFGVPANACMKRAFFADSDPHDGGRRVIIVTLNQGIRIVYKPRPLLAFSIYQTLLSWFNDKGFSPKFRVQKVLDRGSYGWVEHTNQKSCSERLGIQRFYRRLGGHLSLLRILGATDCHHENVIADGEHPQLIDLETLFSPRFAVQPTRDADSRAMAQIADSVLSTGLLPLPTLVNQQIVDLSGIGALSYQETNLEAFQIVTDKSGRLKVTHEYYRLGRTSNRPRWNRREVDPRGFVSHLAEGFRDAYSIICRSRNEFQGQGGFLDKFRDSEVRVLLRPTAEYTSILRETHHPTSLYDGTERDLVLAQLWRGIETRPHLKEAVQSEFGQLRQGDIPFFRTLPKYTNIYADYDSPPVLIVAESGTVAAQARLSSMNTEDLALQVNLTLRSVDALRAPHESVRKASNGAAKYSPLDLACSLGMYLFNSAIRENDEAVWLSPRSPGEAACPRLGETSVRLPSSNLYDGLCGIIVFLCHLDRATGDRIFGELASSTARTLCRRLRSGELRDKAGAFDGLGGAVYALSQLGATSHQTIWLERAQEFADRIPPLFAKNPNLDFISGLSGALLSVLALVDAARGDRGSIIASLLAQQLCVGLQAEDSQLPYQRGASHGWSGVLLGLTSATAHLKLDVAHLNYVAERELMLTADGTWHDPNDDLHVGQATWCHGPAGIALCRAAAARFGMSTMMIGARSALDASFAELAPRKLGLCHGLAGVLDSLLVGVRLFPNDNLYRQRFAQLSRNLCEEFSAELERLSGVPDLGLMTGLSGVGLQLLRLVDEKTPSVLLLEPPGYLST